MRIAVYDSAPDDCNTTAEAVQACFEAGRGGADIIRFTDGENLVLTLMQDDYDMLFLGVNGMLDVETARSAARIGEKRPLFLISRVADYGIEGFRLSALDYLIKPVTKERVCEALTRVDPLYAKHITLNTPRNGKERMK